MKEFGGYFELEQFCGCEYHSTGVLRFNYCRFAWQYLLEARKITKIYIPYYICDSLIVPAMRSGVQIEYYHIDESFCPVCEHIPTDREAILIVNYFGFLNQQKLQSLVDKYKHIIVDNTQAFFARPIKDVDTLYSCRKFFGVPDGGYLFAQGVPTPTLSQDSSADRMNFLTGRLEDGAQKHYLEFRRAEDNAEEEGVKSMSNTTQNLLRGIDYERVKAVRTQNYQRMHEQLRAYNVLNHMPALEGPYIYPLYFKGDAQRLRTFLAENHVYVPVLWNNVYDVLREDCLETRLVSHILPLPIDQRYTIADVDEISAIVERGIKQ